VKRKTFKKNQFLELTNCLSEPPASPTDWASAFGRVAPLVVELGAGRCDFSLGFAALFPEWNVLAVDVKPERLWAGGRRALEQNLPNVRFLRLNVEHLAEAFAPGSIQRLWITFPDPYPKLRHARRRLTAPGFLERYRPLLAPGAEVHLKTDDPALFAYTLDTLAQVPGVQVLHHTHDLYAPSPLLTNETGIRTYYEQKWIAERWAKIHYVAFRLLELPTENKSAEPEAFS
jgi:tRNA (guanine-N7-)-methyltransferase